MTFKEKFARLIALHPIGPNCLPQGMTLADITVAGVPDAEGVFQPFAESMYATDTDNLNLLMTDALDDCSPDSIWPLLHKARASALTAFEESLYAGIATSNKSKYAPFSGNIGQYDSSGTVNVVNGQRVTTTITPRPISGAMLKITKIGLLLDSDADVAVSVPGLGSSLIVVSAANTPSFADLPTPIRIPLDGQPLSFAYTVNGFRPRNNKLNCDCSGLQARLGQFFPDLVDRPANGLLIQCEITCDPLDLIIGNFDDVPMIQRVMKMTLQYKTLEKAIERIQNSGVVSRYTMMESQYLWGKRNNYRAEYQDRINFLTSNDGFAVGQSGCFACKPQVMSRGAILA